MSSEQGEQGGQPGEIFLKRIKREQDERDAAFQESQRGLEDERAIRYQHRKDPGETHETVTQNLKVAQGINRGMTLEEAQLAAGMKTEDKATPDQITDPREESTDSSHHDSPEKPE
jgi:hypothetical protein